MEFKPLSPKAAATCRLSRDHRINIWEGAIRSGKTISSLLAWAEFIANGPEGPLLMVGKTIDTLRRNVIEPLTEMLGMRNVKVVWGIGVAHILGRKIHLVGASNDMAETRIRGLTLAGAYVDEVTILPLGFWQMLLSRLSVKGARLFGTTNPASPQHWLLMDYLQRARTVIEQDGHVYKFDTNLDLARYRFVLEDNRENLPENYIEDANTWYTGLFHRRFIGGEWVAAEGAVFPSLDYAPASPMVWHELPPAEALQYVTIGIDHGMSNPTHAVAVAVHQGKVYVLSELRLDKPEEMRSIAVQAELVEQWIRNGCPNGMGETPLDTIYPGNPIYHRIVVDPAAKAFRSEWNDRGLGWPWAAENTVVKGIQRVGALLDTNKLLFSPRATPILTREMSGYSWDMKAQEQGIDKPIKQDDHAVDALRYAIMAVERAIAIPQ